MSHLSDPRYGDDWEGAVCAQIGAVVADDMFFATARDRVAQAVALCWDCPLRAMCARAALEEEAATPLDMRFGVRGGLTPEQRVQLQPHRICRDCGSPIVTRSPHYDDDREVHRLKHRREYDQERRRDAA